MSSSIPLNVVSSLLVLKQALQYKLSVHLRLNFFNDETKLNSNRARMCALSHIPNQYIIWPQPIHHMAEHSQTIHHMAAHSQPMHHMAASLNMYIISILYIIGLYLPFLAVTDASCPFIGTERTRHTLSWYKTRERRGVGVPRNR